MKTIQDLNFLIDKQAAYIKSLDSEKRGGASNERWAVRQKKIIKLRGKCKDEITRLRKLILFVERTPEEGVWFMYEKLIREVSAATETAHRMFNFKSQIREYLTKSNIPLKKKQIKELKFLLSRHPKSFTNGRKHAAWKIPTSGLISVRSLVSLL